MKGRFERKDFEQRALGYLDSFYFVALRITGKREDAEDLVQETYRKAFDRLNQLRDLEKCKLWLYRILINTWKNWNTVRSRESSSENPEQREGSATGCTGGNPQRHQMSPEEELINRELWAAVESALSQLPPQYKMAILLSDIEGFSYKEISKIMQWPLGTVMSRLSRARSLLGLLLKKYKEET